MTTPRIDPVAFKEQQRNAWNAISSGWAGILDTFERGGAPVTRRLLELGGVRPGRSVLDIGTGLGEPALTAAALVGPAGRVVGVDLSPAMLEIAERRAGGAANVTFVTGDAESVDLPAGSFDVVLSRWGLMFAFDRVAMFRGLARLLRPGGVLSAAVWGPPESVPMMALGYSVISRRLELPPPPPGGPGPFSMSDPSLLADELTAAGFTDVSVTEFIAPFRLDTTQDYIDLNRTTAPPGLLAMVRDRFGSEDDPGTWQAIGDAVQKYRSGDGLSLPSTALCMRGVVP